MRHCNRTVSSSDNNFQISIIFLAHKKSIHVKLQVEFELLLKYSLATLPKFYWKSDEW